MDGINMLEMVKRDSIRWIDLQFVDVPGALQHITVPAHTIGEGELVDGIGKLDGSSIKGFKAIFESDMVLMPDQSTYRKVPWDVSTARVFCNIYESGGKERFTRDPRFVAQRAEKELAHNG